MKSSWKTTLAGVLSAVGAYLKTQTDPAWLATLGNLLTYGGLAGMGIFARDNNVTSEQAGAADPIASPPARPPGSKLPMFIPALAALLFASGCSTLPNGQVAIAGHVVDPARVAADVRLVAREGTRYAVRKEPQSLPYFQAALVILQSNIDAGNFDADALKAAILGIKVKEIQAPDVADAIAAGFELYKNHISDVVAKKLDATVYLKPVLVGIRDGIAAGLAP